LDLLLRAGIPAVAQRVLGLTDHLCEQARRAGLEGFSSRQPADRSGIVSLVAPGADLAALVRRCRQDKIVVNLRAGRLRISAHCYNPPAELEQAVAVLASGGGSNS